MNTKRLFVTTMAVGLAGILGVACEYEGEETLGYESPTEYEYEEEGMTEPADPIGEPDFGETDTEFETDVEIEDTEFGIEEETGMTTEEEFGDETALGQEEFDQEEFQEGTRVPEGAEIPEINRGQSPTDMQDEEQQTQQQPVSPQNQ